MPLVNFIHVETLCMRTRPSRGNPKTLTLLHGVRFTPNVGASFRASGIFIMKCHLRALMSLHACHTCIHVYRYAYKHEHIWVLWTHRRFLLLFGPWQVLMELEGRLPSKPRTRLSKPLSLRLILGTFNLGTAVSLGSFPLTVTVATMGYRSY